MDSLNKAVVHDLEEERVYPDLAQDLYEIDDRTEVIAKLRAEVDRLGLPVIISAQEYVNALSTAMTVEQGTVNEEIAAAAAEYLAKGKSFQLGQPDAEKTVYNDPDKGVYFVLVYVFSPSEAPKVLPALQVVFKDRGKDRTQSLIDGAPTALQGQTFSYTSGQQARGGGVEGLILLRKLD